MADDFFHDLVLESRLEGRGQREVTYFGSTAVAAFLQQTLGWNVAAEVVAVTVQPQSLLPQLASQSQCIIDADFTSQEDDRQVVTEGPCLNGIREVIQ